MRFAATTTVAGLAAVAAAQGPWGHGHGPESYGPPQGGNATASWGAPVSYITSVVTDYTTYCPEATQVTYGSSTYTVTAATTLTISGPCTVTMPVYTSTTSACTTCSSAPSTTPVAPVSSTTPVAPVTPYPVSNGTTPVAPTAYTSMTSAVSVSASSASASASSPVAYTGAAVAKAVPAGLLAVFGLVAAL